MSDIYTKRRRSEIMAKIRSRANTATELRFISLLRSYRITGWRRKYPLFGNPDFVFPQSHVVIFVDGEFWHGHPVYGSTPKSNVDFWKAKISSNIKRDKLVNKTLRAKGWIVIRIWQRDLAIKRQAQSMHRVKKTLAMFQ